jgi:NADPH:quinone reductase-like Zn-dependent oxidoreductase
VLKPADISFEAAATVPIAGLTALQLVRDQGQVQAGQKVLISGAGGGVGTFAVQVAKAFGAEVTAASANATWTSRARVERIMSLITRRKTVRKQLSFLM